MKKNLMVWALVICCAFSGCGNSSDVKKTTDQSGAVAGATAPDYSSHVYPDEEWYQTVLADPAELRKGKPVFALETPAVDWSWIQFGGLTNKDATWGYDVRSCDISGEDLSVVEDYSDLSFDSDTIWPEKLPDGFDPEAILEYNMDPGLGIRALHRQGVTGEGVGIAIIDQGLLLGHEQYRDSLMYYEMVHCSEQEAAMHGPAVASIAVGKDIGVAPGAKLYYIASTFGHFIDGSYEFDASIMADCILRVLEINENLPENEKIRVISISRGYSQEDKGYAELESAITRAKGEGIFVITASTEVAYQNFELFGMTRDYMDDPNDFASYDPARWVIDEVYRNPQFYENVLLFPMSRTFAGCTGTSDYQIVREGGLSWAVPWCAGFYALCCQVKPDITPEEFIEILNTTSVPAQTTIKGLELTFGKIPDPAAVIRELEDRVAR